MRFIFLALFLGACENSDDTTNPTDDTDTPTLYEAAFSATLNQYGWEGDAVVLLGSAEKAANFIATSDGGETVNGTTPETLELTAGTWTSSYYYDESTMLYLGWATADLSVTPDLGATLCADLSGDWECDVGYMEDLIETDDAVMNGCSVQLDGLSTLEIDGNKVSAVAEEGSTINGIVMGDSINMILNRSDGFTCEMVCNGT